MFVGRMWLMEWFITHAREIMVIHHVDADTGRTAINQTCSPGAAAHVLLRWEVIQISIQKPAHGPKARDLQLVFILH